MLNLYCALFKKITTVFGSDVVYSEGAVKDLIVTLVELCGKETTVILAGELRNGMEIKLCYDFHWL